jgi:hypothetical protein
VEARVASGVVAREGTVTRTGVWAAWVAANVVPSLVVSVLLFMGTRTLGTDRSAVLAYVLLFALVAAWQGWVWVRWRGTGSALVSGRRWVVVTLAARVVAMFFGVGIVATLDGLGHERLGLVAGWTVAGAIVGATQAAALRASRPTAWWWIAASVAGWATAAALYVPLAAIGSGLARAPIVRWLVGGLALEGNIELGITALTFALTGMLTGVVLARLTPRSAREA